MDSTIIVAIISGLCGSIPSVLATISSNKRSNDLVVFRLQELEKKVEKHNSVVERMALAEQSIKTMWKKIDELKSEHVKGNK